MANLSLQVPANMTIAAILFDLDGTLANTDPIHFQTWQDLLKDYGMDIDKAFYQSRISGGLNGEIVQDILPQLSPEAGKRVAEEKEARFRQLGTQLERLGGLDDVLTWTEEGGVKRALVTNAPPENVEFMLEVLQLGDRFDVKVLAENAPIGKPDPTPYNLALEQLGISPAGAIAFEDSPAGIRAAVGAGIYTIGVATTHDPHKLLDLGAGMAIADFTDADLWQRLLRRSHLPSG